jgi:plasmid stability protein
MREKRPDPFVVTNIRLPVALHRRMRRLAAQHGMSFSSFVRALLTAYTHQVKVRGTASVQSIDRTAPREKEPIWDTTLLGEDERQGSAR